MFAIYLNDADELEAVVSAVVDMHRTRLGHCDVLARLAARLRRGKGCAMVRGPGEPAMEAGPAGRTANASQAGPAGAVADRGKAGAFPHRKTP